MMRQLLSTLVLTCALFAAACSDSTESGDIPPARRFDTYKIPFTDPAGCNAAAAKRNDTYPVTACRCERCLERMQECAVVPGCKEIVECTNRTGCSGELGCYLLPRAPCAETIDEWGNSSLATTIALEIMDCSTASQCR